METESSNLTMACDPSIREFGVAIIDNNTKNVIFYDCIKSKPSHQKKVRKTDDKIERAKILSQRLIEIITSFNPRIIVSENPHGSQSVDASTFLNLAVGTLLGVCEALDKKSFFFYEGDVKNGIFGTHEVEKKQTSKMIKSKYNLNFKYKYIEYAVCDAILVYEYFNKIKNILDY